MSDPPARALKALQRLTIQLYFSETLQAAWAKDPRGVSGRFGVPVDWIGLVPRIDTEAFAAECWGRRLMIARELHYRFPQTIDAFCGVTTPPEFAKTPLFSAFLDSENFFDPKNGLPHPYGLGPGYDNVSKFFRWLGADIRSAFLASRNLTKKQVKQRKLLYTEFGVFLIGLLPHARHHFFSQFKRGIFFRVDPGRSDHWIWIDADCEMNELRGPAEAVFKSNRLFNLDKLVTTG